MGAGGGRAGDGPQLRAGRPPAPGGAPALRGPNLGLLRTPCPLQGAVETGAPSGLRGRQAREPRWGPEAAGAGQRPRLWTPHTCVWTEFPSS